MKSAALAAAAICLATVGAARSEEIIVNSSNQTAVLGTAYHTEEEKFGAVGCLGGADADSGAARSSFSLDQTMSEEQLAKELGFSVGARARYGAVEGSLEANFLSRSTSNAFSIVAIYRASYLMPVRKRVSVQVNEVGKAVENNPERWTRTCGDRFVSELSRGAKLFVSVRIDFSSQAKKEEFSGSFNVSGPLASANGALKTASTFSDRKARVVVSAYQVGGDVSKLTAILGGAGAGIETYTQCTLGKFDSCATFIGNVLAYASDTATGFPSQLAPNAAPGPAVLAYSVSPYEDVGIYDRSNPILTQAIKLARRDLSDRFEENYAAANVVRRLLDHRIHSLRRSSLEAIKVKVDANIASILPVAATCYERPLECPDAVRSLRLERVPQDDLKPTTFLAYCLEATKVKDDNHPFKRQISFLLGAAEGRPNSGLYVTEANCVKASGMLLANPSLTYRPQLADLSFIAELTHLRKLFADGASGSLRDVSALAEFQELRELKLSDHEIEDLSPLANIARLEELYLRRNRIRDLAPLRAHKDLLALDVRENRVVDLTPVGDLSRLIAFHAGDNIEIEDVTPLAKLKGLRSVDLTNTRASHASISALAKAIPDLQWRLTQSFEKPEQWGTFEQFVQKWYK